MRRLFGRPAALVFALVLGLLLPGSVVLGAWAARPASPPTFVVNSTADAVAAGPLADGICSTTFPYPAQPVCTLRAASIKANHFPGGGVTIQFDPAKTNGVPIGLTIVRNFAQDDETNGDLNISQTTRLLGNGAGLTLIDGLGANDRVFAIATGAVVSLSGLTVQNGHVGQYGGGGLLVAGGATLVLDHSAVISNTDDSGLGGGGLSSAGTLTVSDSLIGANTSTGSGGGLLNVGGRDLIQASTVLSNRAGGDGGGIDNFGPLLNLIQSTVVSNTASVDGGGVATASAGPSDWTANVINSTIHDNVAGGAGGGLKVLQGGQLNLINSTVSDNSAAGYGGGVDVNQNGVAHLYNATVAVNRADVHLTGAGKGGGLSLGSGSLQFQNSLIVGNHASAQIGGNWLFWPDDCTGGVSSAGYNLLSYQGDCPVTLITGDVVTMSFQIGPLQANGGPTWTHALLPGSPAIDAGDPGGCSGPTAVPLASDQRGQPRTANGAGQTRCDMGAFERQRLVNLPLTLR